MKERMFHKVFVEEEVREHPRTKEILAKVSLMKAPIVAIAKIEEVFGKVRKPYLHKRTDLNLFIGKKRGTLLKEAPAAYGAQGDPHYYFIHAYNCLYECEYCYLQGYFPSPDLVIFINHEDIGEEITRVTRGHEESGGTGRKVWFHAGEFSDSLALSHLTQEWGHYFDLFRKLPNAILELRTKSANIRPLLSLEPARNVITSFSLSPACQSEKYDHGAPPLKARLHAMKLLSQRGHPLAIHFDPIIADHLSESAESDLLTAYDRLLTQIDEQIPLEKMNYLSLGVVRFTKKVFRQVQKNYPHSDIVHSSEYAKSYDDKIRYSRPLRLWILKSIRRLCEDRGIDPAKIYFCMEK